LIRALTVGTGVALVLGLLRTWHVLLLRRHLDQPLVIASSLAGVFLLFLALRALSAKVPVGLRTRVDRFFAGVSGLGVLFVAFVLCLLFVFHWGFERAASDGREYFVQVRSLVIDGDLDFENENAAFGVRGTAEIYPFGAPLLWVPFFVACHLWFMALNAVGGGFAVDGFANPYQRAIGLGTLIYGCIGLLLAYRLLRDYFSATLSAVATVAACCGSFVIWYLVVENSMVHGISMFSTALFLFLWHRTRARRTVGQWGLLGASAGLMSMVRWQDAVFAVTPVILDVARAGDETDRSRARSMVVRLTTFAAAAVVAFMPQLIFWKVVRGSWLSVPTGEHAMGLPSHHVWDVLFSPNHGLLSWTPIVYLALLGLLVFFRRDRVLAIVLGAAFVAQVCINGAVSVWWGGSGFGARRFANCFPVFAVGLASCLAWLARRPLLAPMAVVGVLIAGNAAFMWEMRMQRLPSGEGISFDRILTRLYERVGNPFAFPMSAYVASTYGVGLSFYDRLEGRTYNNVSIEFGEEGDERFLGSGWSGREQGPRFSFRWAEGLESVVVVPLMSAADYDLELWCAPFQYPGAPPQAIDVQVNGRPLVQLTLSGGMQSYRVAVPAALLRHNLNLVRFAYRYAASPRSVGMSDDPRRLAVQFSQLQLRRLSSREESP
jgi:hypothetical protein